MPDFFPHPPKSGFNIVRLGLVRNHCFSRQANLATLGSIFFGVWSWKFDKQWKDLRDRPENFPTGFHRVIRLSLGLRPSGKSEFPWDLPRANFTRQPLRTFYRLYQTLCYVWQCKFGYSIFALPVSFIGYTVILIYLGFVWHCHIANCPAQLCVFCLAVSYDTQSCPFSCLILCAFKKNIFYLTIIWPGRLWYEFT